jgi:hypothetical protein
MKQYKRERGEFPEHIDIVASSMGGLITREFLAHRQLDVYGDPSRMLNLKVGKVIMIATPNAGTLVADRAMAWQLALVLTPVVNLFAIIGFWVDCDFPLPRSLNDLETKTAQVIVTKRVTSLFPEKPVRLS